MRRFIYIFALIGFISTFAFAKEINLPYYEWKLKEGKGKETFEQYCLMCHSPGYIFNLAKGKNKPRNLWEQVVHHMVHEFKAPIPEDAQKKIINYLNNNYR